MRTLSGSNTKPSAAAKRAASSRFQLRAGHILAAALLFSLLAWGALFLVIKLIVAAFR